MNDALTTAYFAQEKYAGNLAHELKNVRAQYGRLFIAEGAPQQAVWAQNVWYEPQRVNFSSISEAVRTLTAMQRNWALYSYASHRRAALIEEQLPHVSAKPLTFPAKLPSAPLGAFTLIDQHTMLCAPRTSSAFRNGEVQFNESKDGPPNRAYLKLWEAFTILQAMPQPGERCLEVGASPGGWTWVLASIGANVLAIDRAELAPAIARMKNVKFKKADAFAMLPQRENTYEWVFSDVVAYPDKLFAWAMNWIESGSCRNLLCTVKFQGTTHYNMIPQFSAIPGSVLMHLSTNKHELTFVWRASEVATHS